MIANACFSDGTSNGRTLKNLFARAEPAKLAQFFVYGDPDFSICGRYYQVSDRDALASLNPLRAAGGPAERGEEPDREAGNLVEGRTSAGQKPDEPTEGRTSAGQKSDEPTEGRTSAGQKPGETTKGRIDAGQKSDESMEGKEGFCQADATEKAYMGVANKTPVKMLLRELVWLLGHWKGRRLWQWIEEFEPERLCLFLANNTFLIRLAAQIARKYRIPLVVYTTEGYCFMDYNYFTNRPSLVYRLYYKWLWRTYRKVSAYVTEGFFNCTLLRDRYADAFGYPCKCIMNGSETPFLDRSALEKRAPVISYLGNLGLGRSEALVEVGQALQEIDPSLHLDIYGAAPDDQVKEELTGCSGIRFHGFVPYEEVVRIIHESSLLVHAEKNDPIVNRDLQYAFSTKIGDSVCSGTPLLIYADEGLAETLFLKENDCAFVAGNREMLKPILRQALTDEKERRRIVENARIAKERFFTGNEQFMEAFL